MRFLAITCLLVVALVLNSCDGRKPTICLQADVKRGNAIEIRSFAAQTAKSRGMRFADKSGQYPFEELDIYFQLYESQFFEGFIPLRGVEVGGSSSHFEGYPTLICFYADDPKDPKMHSLVDDFSRFFDEIAVRYKKDNEAAGARK